ncbi:hypothetical protein EhV145 [Emiliania huxleyi virus 86]|uniref:Uncharacterized protein n=1 Tax=Emiliania huxleyi virus 86 (isolate United Kingdom/English Channel/1999) TaxID=654925 RepID=Q4A2Y9_EHV8U|nr:hypothetical protein EhV145 [Emiliania huxleyi virus 86]AEO97578.1 hypothetical protein ENVG_00435 [Emiliania huxleyi virus 84]AEP15396.1 hypothetical protein EOVG_00459 [Emiliania huxleyi virus 88]AHA54731.1 hypothetical protein EhV145_00180 [Emiliania huxleyi virus 145]AHA55755.1 hypothetical protein EhV164_00165 [Emiliania huxleyi virus 164]CAI65567.1 hypothetical protein EhV145 [Emiliania huxleyi virus 86]
MAVVSSVPGSRAEGMKVRKASDPPPPAVKTANELKAEKKATKALKKEQKKKNDESRKAAKKAAKKPVESRGTKKTEREPPKHFTTKNTTNLPKEIRTANPNVKLGQREESKSKSPLRILGM